MTQVFSKFKEEIVVIALDWSPALGEGDSIAAGSGTVTAVSSGRTAIDASLIETVGTVSKVRLGATDNFGDWGRVTFLAQTASGERLREDIRVIVTAPLR